MEKDQTDLMWKAFYLCNLSNTVKRLIPKTLDGDRKKGKAMKTAVGYGQEIRKSNTESWLRLTRVGFVRPGKRGIF